jgi:hypothetical protein
MIYKYPNRYIVQFSDGSRASYSIKRYGELIEKISRLSEKLDKKIWNYFEINGNDCNSISIILKKLYNEEKN